jgi:sortase (surface protein transpeptidase)
MSSGRHRRDSAPDEQPWPDQNWTDQNWPDRDQADRDWPGRDRTGQARRRHARDETTPDLPAWRDPAHHDSTPYEPAPYERAQYERAQYEQAPRRVADETSVDLTRPALDETSFDLPRPAADETSLDLPAWPGPARPEQRRPEQRQAEQRQAEQRQAERAPRRWAPDETFVDLPRPTLDETSVDLLRPAADETSLDLPAWRDQDLPQLPPRRPTVDETVLDLPAWDDRPRRAQARTGPPGRSQSGRPQSRKARQGKSKGPVRLMIAAAAVVVIGIGVSVYGLTTKTTVAGAQYTPSTVGSSVPNAKPDPAALALSRSMPVKIQIPSIGVSAPIEQVGLLTNGEVQTPSLTVHNLTGWYKYGPTPGEDGASVILGHVDDYKGLSVFYYLKDLAKGDQIDVTLADGITANFVVDGLQKASKDDFPTQQVYGKIGYPGLRLITCGGSFDSATGHYDDNIIVYAHLVHSATT